MPGQFDNGEVAFAYGPLDVIEPDPDGLYPFALPHFFVAFSWLKLPLKRTEIQLSRTVAAVRIVLAAICPQNSAVVCRTRRQPAHDGTCRPVSCLLHDCADTRNTSGVATTNRGIVVYDGNVDLLRSTAPWRKYQRMPVHSRIFPDNGLIGFWFRLMHAIVLGEVRCTVLYCRRTRLDTLYFLWDLQSTQRKSLLYVYI